MSRTPPRQVPAFPWREAIGFGLGTLRLAPDAFWRMTPRELSLAIAARRGFPPKPLDRASLKALMARFPDRGAGPAAPAAAEKPT